ncbi:MAG: PepSY domain-containing protein [Cyanobacteria bacterium P01_B01_bin.77]
MAIAKHRIRKLHSTLAPIMALPLLLTLLTGLFYQMALVSGRGGDFLWLLALHRGKLFALDLSMIYPFLNALGLLTLLMTGFTMWWQTPKRQRRH